VNFKLGFFMNLFRTIKYDQLVSYVEITATCTPFYDFYFLFTIVMKVLISCTEKPKLTTVVAKEVKSIFIVLR
jgi:hypothetical protein